MGQPVGRPRIHMDNCARQKAYRERQATWRKRHSPKVYHAHQTTEWETPQPFFDQVHSEFGFTLDVAAQPSNAKCPRYFTPEDDGLVQSWGLNLSTQAPECSGWRFWGKDPRVGSQLVANAPGDTATASEAWTGFGVSLSCVQHFTYQTAWYNALC
jgi:hypothetical protein